MALKELGFFQDLVSFNDFGELFLRAAVAAIGIRVEAAQEFSVAAPDISGRGVKGQGHGFKGVDLKLGQALAAPILAARVGLDLGLFAKNAEGVLHIGWPSGV